MKLRIGLIGAGENTRRRHLPGLRALPDVEIVAVCNRRPESTARIASDFGIPRTYEAWQDLVESPDVDAIVIGTWPHLHCPITVTALELGKHVLTEARMCLNAGEAHQMLAAARRQPHLVAQIVPSPYGLKGHRVMKRMLAEGYVGQPREMHLHGLSGHLADAATPLSWRQDALLSGFNMLNLGILHETVSRWVSPVIRVLAQAHAFVPARVDPASGVKRPVGTPDSVQVLTIHADGLRGSYQFSGVVAHGPGTGVRIHGSEGTLVYDFDQDRVLGVRLRGGQHSLQELPIPSDQEQSWQVEADFVAAIRESRPVTLTDFATGVQYMEFTEAVARSARLGEAVALPLEEFVDDEVDSEEELARK